MTVVPSSARCGSRNGPWQHAAAAIMTRTGCANFCAQVLLRKDRVTTDGRVASHDTYRERPFSPEGETCGIHFGFLIRVGGEHASASDCLGQDRCEVGICGDGSLAISMHQQGGRVKEHRELGRALHLKPSSAGWSGRGGGGPQVASRRRDRSGHSGRPGRQTARECVRSAMLQWGIGKCGKGIWRRQVFQRSRCLRYLSVVPRMARPGTFR